MLFHLYEGSKLPQSCYVFRNAVHTAQLREHHDLASKRLAEMLAFLIFQPMEKYYVYIIYSKTLDRFYTGATCIAATTRLERHLFHFYGDSKFTSKAPDWELFYSIACESYPQALQIEQHIKRMKSSRYIRNLARYSEITETLIQKYKF